MLISLGLGRYIENIAYFEQIGGRMYFVDKGISSDPNDPPGDFSVGVRVNIAPVGCRLSLFVAQWQNITRDHFIFSVVRQGFSDFSSIQFSGGVTGSHRTPQQTCQLVRFCRILYVF